MDEKGNEMVKKAISNDPFQRFWKSFASVKLTVFLLLSLAATSILGTLIPQNKGVDAYRQAFGDVIAQVLITLDVVDMYHSWWFQLLLILLVVNIFICSYERLKATWKIIFTRNPKFNIERFRNLKSKNEFSVNLTTEQIRRIAEPVIGRFFRYRQSVELDNEVQLFAEKWRWTRLGVYIVHFSVILLLVGGLIGSIFGFEGFANIPEGESIQTIRLRNTGEVVKLDFEIRCDDFDLSFYESGQPKEYRSRLTILEQGKPVVQKDIVVNDPLRYRGINIFQSSYGEMPSRQQVVSAPETVTVNFTSTATGMVYPKEMKFGQTVAIPEGLGRFTLKAFSASYNFRGRELGSTLMGELVQPEGQFVEVVLPVQFPSFDRMSPMFNDQRSDAVFIAVDDFQLSPTASNKRYFTGLQVTKDPGVWVVYSGFILMIIGCIVTFFMSHQRIAIAITSKGNTRRVMVAGTATKNRLGMQQKVTKITDLLRANAKA